MDFVEVKKESQVLKYLFSQFFLGLSCALSKGPPVFWAGQVLVVGMLGFLPWARPALAQRFLGFSAPSTLCGTLSGSAP